MYRKLIYIYIYIHIYTHTHNLSLSLSLSLSPNVHYIKNVKPTHLIKICKFYLKHFRKWYVFSEYVKVKVK